MTTSRYYKNAAIFIAVLTGYTFFAGTVRSKDVPVAELVQSNTAQTDQQATGWQNLDEFVKKSNLDMIALLKYGTPELRDEIIKLQNDPFGVDKDIQDKLKTRQKQIAEGKFYLDTTLELDADKIKVGGIKTEAEIHRVTLRNKLTGDPDLWTFGFQDFFYEAGQGETGTLTGKTEDMKELYRNRDNYTLRIYITGLKITANEKDPFSDTEPERVIIGNNAECIMLQYEICKKGSVPALKYADISEKVKSAKEKFVAKKKAEEERIAKETQARQEAEAQAKAEQERQAAEQRRIAEVKAAEEKRKADEIRRKTDAVTKAAEEQLQKAAVAVNDTLEAAKKGNAAEVDNAIKAVTDAAKEAEEIVAAANKQGIDTSAASKAADKANEAVGETKKVKAKMLAEAPAKQAVEEAEAALKKTDGLARQAENSSKVAFTERILERTKEAEKNVRNAAAKFNELSAGFSFPELTARAENAVSKATDAVTKARKALENAKENDPDYVANLKEWVQDNGWSLNRPLGAILTYGTEKLQNDLAMATDDKNAAEIKNAVESIKSQQKKIAAKKFYCDIDFRMGDVRVGNGQATFDITLPGAYGNELNWYYLYFSNKGVEWWFCLPNCKHKDNNNANNGSISGVVNEIDKLTKNGAHYFLRVYLTELKIPDRERPLDITCKIDRYEIREVSDRDWKPKNYVPTADINSGDITETDLPLVTEFKKVQVTISGETFSGQILASNPAQDSPLAPLGLKKGDVVTHLNGNPIGELTPEIIEKTRGKTKVRYIKDGRRQVEGTTDIP